MQKVSCLILTQVVLDAFSAFMLLVGRQEGGGVLASLSVCMAQLMPLPLTVSCFRLVLPFWYRLTWVVPDKGPLNGCVYMYVCVCLYVVVDKGSLNELLLYV